MYEDVNNNKHKIRILVERKMYLMFVCLIGKAIEFEQAEDFGW